MKRFLLIIIALMLALPIFAQSVMTTTYDLQSNGFVSNRMYQDSDGNVAVVATMSNRLSDASFTDRGTGYNFFDGNSWGEKPTSRVEANATGADMRTGWPSIAPYGAEGEILVNHTSGLNYWIREKAGEGVWDGPYAIPNPTVAEFADIENGMTLSWPRVVTTGENNDVVHIFAASQGNETVAQFYVRSSDLVNWDLQYAPLKMDDLHINFYGADDNAVSSNGDNIAVVYCTGLGSHVMCYESNDAGLTWTSRMVWESPLHGLDWETDENSLVEKLYAPIHASVAIGKDGVSHVALSVAMYDHKELGTTYSIYSGMLTDGVAYWNDTTEYKGVLGPIRSSQDNSLKHALRLWWTDEDNSDHATLDQTNFCAWMPPHKEYGFSEFDNEKQYTGSKNGKIGDYQTLFGLTAYPSIAVDPAGNLAVAYSSPDMNRDLWYDANGKGYYMRSIFVNYKPVEATSWMQMNTEFISGNNFYAKLYDNDSIAKEAVFISAVSTPVNENEFWFSCLTDTTPGLYTGSYTSQANITTSTVDVFKYVPDYDIVIDVKRNKSEAGVVIGDGTYANGDNVTLTATPNEGYRFLNWTEDDRVVSVESEYSFKAAIYRDLVANFIAEGYNNVAVSVNSKDAGSVEGAGIYKENANVTLKAVPNFGYVFLNWTEKGEVVSTESEYSFELTADRYLVANFKLVNYDVKVTINPENSGIVTGAGTYVINQNVTLKALPISGYQFVNWTENGEVLSEETEYSFVITSDRNIEANFLPLYNVEIIINPANAGVVEGSGTYAKGQMVNVIAVANEGYEFISLTEKNGELLSVIPDYSFVVTRNIEIVANFAIAEGISELTSDFRLYPNPTNDKLYIETEIEIEDVVVYDVYGKSQNLKISEPQNLSVSVEVSDLNSGVYFIMIKTNDGVVTKRFMKR